MTLATKERFSRSAVLTEIEARLQELEKRHGFSRDWGNAQVFQRGEEVNRAYGEFQCLQDLAEHWS